MVIAVGVVRGILVWDIVEIEPIEFSGGLDVKITACFFVINRYWGKTLF